MKNIVNSLIFILILFSPTIIYAEQTTENGIISLPSTTIKKITYDLEVCKKTKEEVDIQTKSIEQLQEEVRLLKESIELRKQQYQLAEDTIKKYQEINTLQKDTYESLLKESKPNFFETLMKGVSYLGIGVLIGIFL